MANRIWVLRDKMKAKENGTQKAIWELCDILLDQEKKIKILHEDLSKYRKEVRKSRTPRKPEPKLRPDGTPMEFVASGKFFEGTDIPVGEWK